MNIQTETFIDEFQVRNISMGQEGLSPNQGVFVEEVEVTAPEGPSVVFPCRCWLAEDEDDGQTTRVLVPGQSLTSEYDSKHGFWMNLSYDFNFTPSKCKFWTVSQLGHGV